MLVSNHDRSIIHEMELNAMMADYIGNDPTFIDKTYVMGFIEDNLLVIESRVGPQDW